ncbi:hypothetical protein WG915_02810 [Corynebacterium sp. H128]|uniref:hypothetical protein n=1 Tax=Corynebacterium sp. H128 TaxID=3133427 RepID=UPI0030A70591
MSPRFPMTFIEKIAGMAFSAAMLGVLNGAYNMHRHAANAQQLSSQYIGSATERLLLYGVIAFLATGVIVVSLLAQRNEQPKERTSGVV